MEYVLNTIMNRQNANQNMFKKILQNQLSYPTILSHTRPCIDNILSTIYLILRKMFVPASVLNKLTGQRISGKYVIGEMVPLKIRFFYKYIKQNFCWDNYK